MSEILMLKPTWWVIHVTEMRSVIVSHSIRYPGVTWLVCSICIPKILFSLICKSCSKIWAHTTVCTGIFKHPQRTTQMKRTNQNHFWSLNHIIWNLAHITNLEAQTSYPYQRKVTMGWPSGNMTLQLIQMI